MSVGWTALINLIVAIHMSSAVSRCNIPRVDLDSSLDEFDELLLPDSPTIFVQRGRNEAMRHFARKEHLMGTHGSLPVTLSSSNTYSHDTEVRTLAEYINGLSNRTAVSDASTDFYLFGGNHGSFWKHLEALYEEPPCRNCALAGAKTPGLGGNCSGVAFHMHGPGFSEVLHGRKLWLLYPPDTYPRHFSPLLSTCEWYARHHSEAADDPNLFECSIGPGEVLYFPDRWVHATLNLDDYTFFVSLFLDKQLLR